MDFFPPLSDFLDAGDWDCLATAVMHETFGPTRDYTNDGNGVYSYKDARAIDTGGTSGTERPRLDVYNPSIFGEIERVYPTVRGFQI